MESKEEMRCFPLESLTATKVLKHLFVKKNTRTKIVGLVTQFQAWFKKSKKTTTPT